MKKLTKKLTIFLLSGIILFQAEGIYNNFHNTALNNSVSLYGLDPDSNDVHTEY